MASAFRIDGSNVGVPVARWLGISCQHLGSAPAAGAPGNALIYVLTQCSSHDISHE